MKFLHLSLKALRLSLVRVGIGWMFALLAFNFNRISLVELGASGIIVTTLIGMHHFLSPFQVFWGRLADRFPLFGYRRTPYILLGALVGSLVFLTLPSLAIALGSRELWAIPVAAVLFLLFGLAMAANGTATFALITEVTTPTERGTIVAFTHTALVLSAIISAGIASQIMPVYSPEQMQFLYNLTPFIAVGSTLLGLIGMERRQTSSEQRSQLSQPAAHDLPENPFRAALNLLETNTQVRGFFLFMLLAIAGIFLQDAILEVFGGEVFNLTPAETNTFTQVWGGGVLLGMILMGLISLARSVSTRRLATVGGLSTALAFFILALSSQLHAVWLIQPTLLLMGLSVGVFNVGALCMMMEMTVPGHTGLYMGIWGMAQGLGNGLASVLSGGLHTALIESHLLPPAQAYSLIFGLEGVIMVLAIVVLCGISTEQFKELDTPGLTAAVAFDATS